MCRRDEEGNRTSTSSSLTSLTEEEPSFHGLGTAQASDLDAAIGEELRTLDIVGGPGEIGAGLDFSFDESRLE